jgi:hypothetical protein
LRRATSHRMLKTSKWTQTGISYERAGYKLRKQHQCRVSNHYKPCRK